MKEHRRPRDESARNGFLRDNFPGRFVSWIRNHLDLYLPASELNHPHLINFLYTFIKLPISKLKENEMIGAAMDDHSGSGAILLAMGMVWWVLDLQCRGLNIKYDDEGKEWQAMVIALTRSLRAVPAWRAGQKQNEAMTEGNHKRGATSSVASKTAEYRKRLKTSAAADDAEFGDDSVDDKADEDKGDPPFKASQRGREAAPLHVRASRSTAAKPYTHDKGKSKVVAVVEDDEDDDGDVASSVWRSTRLTSGRPPRP
jgi:hypothetical protein